MSHSEFRKAAFRIEPMIRGAMGLLALPKPLRFIGGCPPSELDGFPGVVGFRVTERFTVWVRLDLSPPVLLYDEDRPDDEPVEIEVKK